MSPITHFRREALHVNTTPLLQPSNRTYGQTVAIAAQENTGFLNPSTTIQTDPSNPPAIQPPPMLSSSPRLPQENMQSGTKISLGLIPLIVCVCTLGVFFSIQWRKRQIQKHKQKVTSLPVPLKNSLSLYSLAGGDCESISTFDMNAFSTPTYHGRFRETSIIGRSMEDHWTADRNRGEKCLLDVSLPSPDHPAICDSLGDGSNMFRPTCGNTTKRMTLGSEIANIWLAPLPPPPTCVRQPGATKQTPIRDNYF